MAELVKKLNIQKNGETTLCSIYTTTEEAGASHISMKIDNVTVYVPVVAATDERASGGRVKSSGATQAIAKNSFVPYYKAEYKEPGVFTVNKPAGISSLKLEVAGAGGGGGWFYKEAASGGNGDKKNEIIAVDGVAQVLTITVGAGGAELPNTQIVGKAGDGGTSSVAADDDIIILSAEGGGGAYQTASEHGNVYNGATAGNGEGGKGGTAYAGTQDTDGYANPGEPGWVIIEWGEGIE